MQAARARTSPMPGLKGHGGGGRVCSPDGCIAPVLDVGFPLGSNHTCRSGLQMWLRPNEMPASRTGATQPHGQRTPPPPTYLVPLSSLPIYHPTSQSTYLQLLVHSRRPAGPCRAERRRRGNTPGMWTALQIAASRSSPITSAGRGAAGRGAGRSGWGRRRRQRRRSAGSGAEQQPCLLRAPWPAHQSPWCQWGRPHQHPHSLHHPPPPCAPAAATAWPGGRNARAVSGRRARGERRWRQRRRPLRQAPPHSKLQQERSAEQQRPPAHLLRGLDRHSQDGIRPNHAPHRCGRQVTLRGRGGAAVRRASRRPAAQQARRPTRRALPAVPGCPHWPSPLSPGRRGRRRRPPPAPHPRGR